MAGKKKCTCRQVHFTKKPCLRHHPDTMEKLREMSSSISRPKVENKRRCAICYKTIVEYSTLSTLSSARRFDAFMNTDLAKNWNSTVYFCMEHRKEYYERKAVGDAKGVPGEMSFSSKSQVKQKRRCAICDDSILQYSAITLQAIAEKFDEVMNTTLSHNWKSTVFICTEHKEEFNRKKDEMEGKSTDSGVSVMARSDRTPRKPVCRCETSFGLSVDCPQHGPPPLSPNEEKERIPTMHDDEEQPTCSNGFPLFENSPSGSSSGNNMMDELSDSHNSRSPFETYGTSEDGHPDLEGEGEMEEDYGEEEEEEEGETTSTEVTQRKRYKKPLMPRRYDPLFDEWINHHSSLKTYLKRPDETKEQRRQRYRRKYGEQRTEYLRWLRADPARYASYKRENRQHYLKNLERIQADPELLKEWEERRDRKYRMLTNHLCKKTAKTITVNSLKDLMDSVEAETKSEGTSSKRDIKNGLFKLSSPDNVNDGGVLIKAEPEPVRMDKNSQDPVEEEEEMYIEYPGGRLVEMSTGKLVEKEKEPDVKDPAFNSLVIPEEDWMKSDLVLAVMHQAIGCSLDDLMKYNVFVQENIEPPPEDHSDESSSTLHRKYAVPQPIRIPIPSRPAVIPRPTPPPRVVPRLPVPMRVSLFPPVVQSQQGVSSVSRPQYYDRGPIKGFGRNQSS